MAVSMEGNDLGSALPIRRAPGPYGGNQAEIGDRRVAQGGYPRRAGRRAKPRAADTRRWLGGCSPGPPGPSSRTSTARPREPARHDHRSMTRAAPDVLTAPHSATLVPHRSGRTGPGTRSWGHGGIGVGIWEVGRSAGGPARDRRPPTAPPAPPPGRWLGGATRWPWRWSRCGVAVAWSSPARLESARRAWRVRSWRPARRVGRRRSGWRRRGRRPPWRWAPSPTWCPASPWRSARGRTGVPSSSTPSSGPSNIIRRRAAPWWASMTLTCSTTPRRRWSTCW